MLSQKYVRALSWMVVIFVIIGIVTTAIAFDKKNNYSYFNNSYVGGDAYNYIINGTYFIGYLIIGMSSFLMALLSFIARFYFRLQGETLDANTRAFLSQKETEKLPPI